MKYTVLIFAAAILFFVSCAKDDIAPSIISLNLKMNDTVSNIFSIKLEATDNNEVDKVDLYINDSLVKEDKTIPFVFDWNTLKVDDGKYSIRAEVFDAEGNKAEASSEVMVENALLTIDAGALYYYPHYVIVSDENGNVLDTAALKRYTKTTLKPEIPFEGNSINFVWLRKGQSITTMAGYVHVRRGSEFKLMHDEVTETFKYVKIHFKDVISSFTKIIISTDLYFFEIRSMADTTLIPQPFPYTSDHKLLVQLVNNDGRFYKFYDIDGKTDISISLPAITSPEQHKTILFPSDGEAGYTILAKAKDTEMKYGYYVSNASTDYTGHSLELWYPAEYFTKFSTSLGFIKHGATRSSDDRYNGDIPSSYIQPDADVQLVSQSAGDFKANLSGSMDIYIVDFRNEDKSIQFSVTAPVSCSGWKFPDPGSVMNMSEFTLSRYHPDLITIIDFKGLDLRNKLYDTSIDLHKLVTDEGHYQVEFISFE